MLLHLFSMLSIPVNAGSAPWSGGEFRWTPIIRRVPSGGSVNNQVIDARVGGTRASNRQLRMLVEFRITSNNSWAGEFGAAW